MQREEKDHIFSKRVRAGKRTYFFDVRATRSNDYYLTITESRRQQRDGEFVYEKSKMFIYKEDFNKFIEGLQESIGHIKQELNPDFDYDQFSNEEEHEVVKPEEEKETELPKGEKKDDLFGNSELSWE